MFKAIYLRQNDNKETLASVSELSESQLSDGDIRINVEYSTLNYKDALAITGTAPVVRSWPMVPGIDLAGVIESSEDPRWNVGDKVVVNGWGVGETRWGGLSQKAVMPAEFLTRLPRSFTTKQAMSIGTAGYTAGLCVLALKDAGIAPNAGEILVTGANGGVGSFATSLLSNKGYTVVASTGRLEESQRLLDLGAKTIVDRKNFSASGKPLQQERWAGVIDCVGSDTLANACASTRYGGAVIACGNAGGMDFRASVAPFILRGVRLIGVDSVKAPHELRNLAWRELAMGVDTGRINGIASEVTLEDAIEKTSALLEGKVLGRMVVNPLL
jgi:acrylyl-CoA reductase (NADPH)